MNQAVIVFDEALPTISFAAAKLREALANRGIAAVYAPLTSLPAATEPIRIVLTSMQDGQADIGMLSEPSLSPEGYAIILERGGDFTLCRVTGADPVGAMYGGLDVADAVNAGTEIENIGIKTSNPYISGRGIKFNIPLDARTPSYSDNGDSAQHNIAEMWSMDFWRQFLDDMALYRYNTLSLWNLHPFPSMVQVPEYPDIALKDVKKTTAPIRASLRGTDMSTTSTLANLETVREMTITEKISFWREVMSYAKNRGIDVYIITWNIFTYGTEGNRYGITCDQDNDVTIDYFRASVRCLLETYPLLAGIGVTAGENMLHNQPQLNEEWLWRAYGEGVMDVKWKYPERKIRFIHRAHESALSTIYEAFAAYPDTFDVSYKYSLAHMYSSVHPPFIYRTQGYKELQAGFLNGLPTGRKTWLTVRDDDYYYFRWGDPEFVRQYILNMPPSEQLAGFYMGPDGIVWGREFVSTEPDSPRQPMIKKRWYGFMLWGRLAYDPTVPDRHFERQLAFRFPEAPSRTLFEAWSSASKILPLVTRFHWEENHLDFQWYPEACYSNPERAKGFHTVQHFINDTPMPESGLMSIPDFCEHLIGNGSITGMTPVQVSQELNDYANRTLLLVAEMSMVTDKELRLTIGDLRAMSYLGRYYASKILGAVHLYLYQQMDDTSHQKAAVEHLQTASGHWREYAAQTASQYVPQQLTRQGYGKVDVTALQAQVDHDITIAQTINVKQ
ncbi:carbohydrate-binding family 6 protein [Paenibacillus cremeus]|uniref:Carbohydrate-binding family 6 protein n=1 Tax=Paenibacillus cremeus TaxID=2163881 RepID=A0A559K5Z8_9BACL|nr:carbohydrate-binding family 6 protein [Paenibacillus cremeus]TVY07552.1 carbohydrate-binding family 6 protein [Paenibacillus cremeus]